MNKKYFDTKKDSLEDKINTIASEKVAFSKPVSDVKLSVEKKYFESKQGSLEEIASKVVSESFIKDDFAVFKRPQNHQLILLFHPTHHLTKFSSNSFHLYFRLNSSS